MTSSAPFFARTALTDLTLRVRDLPRVRSFYEDVLGFRAVAEGGGSIELSAHGRRPADVILEHAPDAPEPPAASAGLFHVAFLYPDRASLGRITARLHEHRVPIGSADHGVSEAIYLNDPEGNGVELYADRAPEFWPRGSGPDQVGMVTEPLDLPDLLVAGTTAHGDLMPAATRIGHVHLRVSRLDVARAFYADQLGFAVRQQDYPGAVFLARDGYHHHLAVNTWRSRLPHPAGSRGLARFTIRSSDDVVRQGMIERLRAGGHELVSPADGVVVRDPDGIEINLAGFPPSDAGPAASATAPAHWRL